MSRADRRARRGVMLDLGAMRAKHAALRSAAAPAAGEERCVHCGWDLIVADEWTKCTFCGRVSPREGGAA